MSVVSSGDGRREVVDEGNFVDVRFLEMPTLNLRGRQSAPSVGCGTVSAILDKYQGIHRGDSHSTCVIDFDMNLRDRSLHGEFQLLWSILYESV
jgi:hypothetical protein